MFTSDQKNSSSSPAFVITYLIGLITVICLQKENFGSMKMQAAFILFLATLLATTWAQPIIAEDLRELESGLTKSYGYPAQPTITGNVDALKDRSYMTPQELDFWAGLGF